MTIGVSVHSEPVQLPGNEYAKKHDQFRGITISATLCPIGAC
jgi:hypothetical protein